MLVLILVITEAILRGKWKEPRSSICFHERRVARPGLTWWWLLVRVMYSSFGARSLAAVGFVPYIVVMLFLFFFFGNTMESDIFVCQCDV